ncbi:MAG: hypothetical protein JWL82_102 [Parcubacteria group bacterium]|nr:hypothetical protein [Parcubacteria group bacterium]
MNTRTLAPILIALVVLLISGGLYGLGYYRLAALNEKTKTLANEIGSKTFELARLARAHTALNSLSADEGTLTQYAIGKEEVVPFLGALQAVGKPLGATVEVLSVSDEKSGTHGRISLSLAIAGSFDAVMRTLGAIEYGAYDGVITNLSLDTGTSDAKVATGGAWTAAAVFSVGTRSASSTPTHP